MNQGFKFALIDTIAATPINLALNFVFLSIIYKFEMTPIEAAPFLTAVFFVCAIIRKYIIFNYTGKKNA